MSGNYIEVIFTLPRPGNLQQDLLIAGLGEAGYESFLETETGFNAYIPAGDFSESLLRAALDEVAGAAPGEVSLETGTDDQSAGSADGGGAFAYETRMIAPQNWNKVWESNFDPVVINEKCRIRASFHEADPSFPLEIQIDPKMSFGTGHHETTWLMASWLLEAPPLGKQVLDMGCGTGVLAILAAKTGASRVLAVDTDPVCIESCRENAALNKVEIECQEGNVDQVPGGGFDLILANINRNVLLQHLPAYAEMLHPAGTLLLSGFYEGEDLDVLRQKSESCGLDFQDARKRNRWAAAKFIRASG